MARDRSRRSRAGAGADRLRQDARRLPPRHRPAEREAGRGSSAALRLPAEGAQLRHRAKPARAARGARLGAVRRRPHRRHASARARADAPHAARHPDHDPGVALPAPHVPRAGAPEDRGDGDPRRGARGRRDEARHASRALTRAARARRRAALPAHRPFGDAASAGGDRPLGRRCRSRDRARRRGPEQGARPRGRRPRRGHARAQRAQRAVAARDAGRGRDGPPATRRPPSRSGRRSTRRCSSSSVRTARRSCSSTTAGSPSGSRSASTSSPSGRRGSMRAPAPRLAGARAAGDHRGGPQGGADPVPRRDLEPRARHRHGRGRPRDPGREPEVGRAGPAAGRPRRARARCDLEGPDLPEVPRRPARVRGRGEGDAGRRDRGDGDPAQSARRPRAAGRRDLRRGGDRGRRAVRPRPAAPIRSPSSPGSSSTTSSTCSRGGIRPTSSRSCGRGSCGTGPPA